jgi:hypothetical protein
MTTTAFMSDRPSESDALGRYQFAKSLSTALLSVSNGDGLVVGIEGGWGSGKSTIIGFVKNELSGLRDLKSEPVIVDFNPWMLSNTGAIVDALIAQIAAAINTNPSAPEKALRAGQKLLGYVGLIRHLKVLKYVPGAGFAANIADDFADIVDGISDRAKQGYDALDDLQKLLPSLDLSKRKSDVVGALRELDRPIVVIVDDVDRLPPEEIRIIVQAIKAVADFPRTTYLLAYDRDVVAKALGNGDASSGQSYLEKIIQVAYPIPPLFQYQLRKLIDARLSKLFSILGLSLRHYESSTYPRAIRIIMRLVRQPRDVVRLMNRLMLSLPATTNEVNVMDVIVFEALSQRYPMIRDSVHRHPADFTGHAFRGDLLVEGEDFDWHSWAEVQEHKQGDEQRGWKKYMPLQEPDRTAAIMACSFLFPQHSDETKNGNPEEELHLADPDRLARYFHMTSMDHVPEVKHIHAMLSDPESLAEEIATDEWSELDSVLEWIHNYLPSAHSPDSMGSAKTLIARANRAQSVEGLTADRVNRFASILASLISRADAKHRDECFQLTIMTAPVSVAESVLLEAAANLGKWTINRSKYEPDMPLITNSDLVDALILEWSDRVRKCVNAGVLHLEPTMNSILYRFAQLNFDYEETYGFVTRICATDAGLRKFVSVHVQDSPFNGVDNYELVQDAQVLADRIKTSSLNSEYAWLVEQLTDENWQSEITKQSTHLKAAGHLRAQLMRPEA